MFIAIVLFLALFIFSLWFTGFIAKALGAERPGMLWVFLLFVALVVVQILLGLTPLAQHPIILLVLLIVLATVLYAKILDMKLLNGFLTMLVSSVVTTMLLVGIAIVAGVSLPAYQDYVMRAKQVQAVNEGEITLDTVAMAAETVCQCETDKQCLGVKSQEFGHLMGMFSAANASPANNAKLQRYTQRVLLCTLKPGPYDVANAVIQQKPKYEAKPVFETDDTVIEEQQLAEVADNHDTEDKEPDSLKDSLPQMEEGENTAETETVSEPAYQYVVLADVKKHVGQPVRVLRKSGEKMEGKIISVSAGKIMVEQRRYGGVFSFPLRFKDIEELEVFF